MHRYRDIDPNIRMSCIQSLGVWILSYPSFFLQDLYLKYLGWTLNDKVMFLIDFQRVFVLLMCHENLMFFPPHFASKECQCQKIIRSCTAKSL